jgi:methylated-DNA-protein-cysteine methyltransferase-like protein
MSGRDERAYYERIYTVVEQVPRGQVASYGDVAAIVGDGCDARVVGHALGALGPRAAKVPWQRIINHTGRITTSGLRQREQLEAEGVEFDAKGYAVMERFRWAGPSEEWARARGFNPLPKPEAERPAPQLRLF